MPSLSRRECDPLAPQAVGKMFQAALISVVLILAAVCSSGSGVFVPHALADLRGLTKSITAPANTSVHSVSRLGRMPSSVSQRMALNLPSLRQTAGDSQCESAGFVLLAAVGCAECLVDGTCDETSCVVGQIDGMNQGQFLLCPVGGCCIRVLFEPSSSEVSAITFDGLAFRDGAVEADDVCPFGCTIGLSLDCTNYIVPALDAEAGAKLECA